MAKKASFSKKIEVEVETVEQALEAVKAGADIIMLDNMPPDKVELAYLAVKKLNEDVLVEASGGITPENAPEYAKNTDIISMGWLTHSIRAVHFSLDITKIKSSEDAE